jgi:hypothetical protein
MSSALSQSQQLMRRKASRDRPLAKMFLQPQPDEPGGVDFILGKIINHRQQTNSDPYLTKEFDDWLVTLSRYRTHTHRVFLVLVWMMYSEQFRVHIMANENPHFVRQFLLMLEKVMDLAVMGLRMDGSKYQLNGQGGVSQTVERSVGAVVDYVQRYYVKRC